MSILINKEVFGCFAESCPFYTSPKYSHALNTRKAILIQILNENSIECYYPICADFQSDLSYLIGKKSQHKISSVKKIVGKKFRHWKNNSSLFIDEFFLPGYLETLIELKKH